MNTDEQPSPNRGKKGIDEIMIALDFLEETAVVLAEAIKDGRLTPWDLRFLVRLYRPAKRAFKGIPEAVIEISDLTMPELATIAIRTIGIIKAFARALVS